jgi:hypothetical protein
MGHPHDVDDTYGVRGVHHDSEIHVVALAGDDGSRINVRASQFVPANGDPWPTQVEVDADLSQIRRRGGPASVWLSVEESAAVVAALTKAAVLAAQP